MKKILISSSTLALLVLVGCATSAWNKYPIKVHPDYSCFYGGPEGGTRYYIWKCLGDKRTVVKQSGFGFWTASADKYESACTGKTEIENEQNLDPEQEKCKSKGHWQTEPQPSK